MNDEINYKNNPLNSVGLKHMLTELIDHYGFDILLAYLNINCFRNNPSLASSVKFLKKTDWAREKVEGFYLYSFKNLPKASYQQSQLPPRDRIIPDDQTVSEPAELSLEGAERLSKEREIRAAEFDSNSGPRNSKNSNADKISLRSSSQDNKEAARDSRNSPASPRRLPSTTENPWGIPKK
ncbi:VF530 family DNA-binding protein [Granulosicoccus antarcticus]|nr:VF530 family protein [Granulosicoccus antarcticus]